MQNERRGSPLLNAVLLLLIAPLLLLGAGWTLSTGFGAPWLETHDFTDVSCTDQQVKGGTVWHCSGRSPDVGDHVRLSFVAHDGRQDPALVTATRSPVSDHWVAHSPDLRWYGMLMLLGGAAMIGGAGYLLDRLHTARA